MPENEVTAEGFTELMKALELIQGGKYIKPVLVLMGKSVIDKAGKYPEESEANSPSNPAGHWYQRGLGTVFASGVQYRTSQNLGKQWFVSPGQWSVLIGNPVTYAPYVHGEDQAPYHGQRGWKKLLPTAEAELPEIIDKIWAQVTRIWNMPRPA